MIKITIEAERAEDARADILTLAGMMGNAVVADTSGTLEAPKAEPEKPARAPRKAATPAAATPAASPPADETDRELLEEVPPAPATSAQVVDAGTGQPVVPAAEQVVDAEPVKQMTVEDVQKAAAQLVQKDIEQLKALLKKYDAANVKAVKPAQLGDFAADVLAALG